MIGVWGHGFQVGDVCMRVKGKWEGRFNIGVGKVVGEGTGASWLAEGSHGEGIFGMKDGL